MTTDRKLLVCFIFLIAWVTTGVVAGSLTPPAGAPTSTQKTLGQIDPRIPINAENTPGTDTCLFHINQPGSYYLTGNITGVAGKHGIFVEASDVTIDLNGFTMTGVASSLSGIAGTPAVVRNGTVEGWDSGIHSTANTIVEGIVASGNEASGIAIGGGIIRNCRAQNNTYGSGLYVGNSGIISDCTSQLNRRGIRAGRGSIVVRCTVSGNLGDGVYILNGDALVSECSISLNEGSGISGLMQGLGTGINSSNITDCTI